MTIVEVKAAVAEKPLSPDVEKSLVAHIDRCVQVPARERYSLRLRFERDGSISEPPTSEDDTVYARMTTIRTASELTRCKPISLDAESYDAWREIIVTRSPARSASHSATEQNKEAQQ